MKAIVTVIGRDQVGITAAVCSLLAQHQINILDISQTVLQEYFTMVMLVDLTASTSSIGALSAVLEEAGKAQGLSIRIQREDIFNAMHRILKRLSYVAESERNHADHPDDRPAASGRADHHNGHFPALLRPQRCEHRL